ncbi:VOC family protein [Ramlibacter sp.]|uniref:VOC family protein n=1 Tax=Ramlibacter sp. TaxID=1917967 RepID=UPI0026103919|nr:VOC family protein [Ramlibacter sp.]MDB5957997.1 PhnB protein-like protein [Ramlibacter sp.]
MNSCIPYLYFDGQAGEAMRTYQQILGGELDLLRYSDAPGGAGSPQPGCEPSDSSRVMHALLRFDAGMFMASDAPNTGMSQPMAGMSISLSYTDTAKARKVFDALATGGQVRMPFGKTFWAEGFGMVVDRFGAPWMVAGNLQPV